MNNDSEFIQIKEIVFRYPKSEFCLAPGSFSLDKAEITLLAGANGSGKSTLSKLMAGIYKPQAGEALIDGIPTTKLSLGDIGKKVGYLWQRPEQQLFAQNVLDELLFIDKLNSNKQTEQEQYDAEKSAYMWLDFFELAHLAQRSTFYLSRGEKQRLALAAVLSVGTRYLILDEPTTGLDSARKQALTDYLIKLNKERGVGMTIISHDKYLVNLLCGRMITLENGVAVNDYRP